MKDRILMALGVLMLATGCETLDPYTGESFRYKRTKKGFVVYSLGANLEDNGGNTYYQDDPENEHGMDEWDDHRLRIPPR